jgi:hypothetical protein
MPRVVQRGIPETADPAPGASPARPSTPHEGRFARVVTGLPESLAAVVAGFSVGPMVLLLLGHFDAAIAVPLGCLGAVAAAWFCGVPARAAGRIELGCTLAAIAAAAAWVGYNVRYTAQDVYATRDPATYTITARWLVDHESLQIHAQPGIFGSPPGGIIASGSYAQISGDVLNVQGNHLLPALLALSARLFGTGALFTTNVVLTGLALLVFYGLARRVVDARLALVAMVGLAVSMPLIYVGRDTYSEPLAMLFLMGSLALVHRGFTSRRLADFALAGLVGGSATMVRIDSYGALIALVVAAIVVASVGNGYRRRERYAAALALLAGAAVPTLIGWLDLAKLARQYYDAQHHNIILLLVALGSVAAVSPAVVWIAHRNPARRWLSGTRTRTVLTLVINALLVLTSVALATRPLWSTTRGVRNLNLENMQRRWGAPVDGTRTYNEQTVHWLALYVGWPTLVLAVAGYALLVSSVLRRRDYALAAVVTMGLTMSALYLWSPQIAPDQPWAMRRYVPVVLPLLVVAAVAALQQVWQWGRARAAGRPIVALACVYLVAFPAWVSWPMRHVRDEVPQLPQVQAICAAVGSRGAIVEVDAAAIFGYGQTLRSFCNVPTIGLVGATPDQLAAVKRSVTAHGRVLYVLSQDPARAQYAAGSTPPAFSRVVVQRWPTQINKAPDTADGQTYTMFLSTVDDAGFAHPVPPPSR